MGEEGVDERVTPNNATIDEHMCNGIEWGEGEAETLRPRAKIGNGTLQGVEDHSEDAKPDAGAGVTQQPRESWQRDGKAVLEPVLCDLVKLCSPLVQGGEAVGGRRRRRRRLSVPRALRWSLLDTAGVGIGALELLKALEVWLFAEY